MFGKAIADDTQGSGQRAAAAAAAAAGRSISREKKQRRHNREGGEKDTKETQQQETRRYIISQIKIRKTNKGLRGVWVWVLYHLQAAATLALIKQLAKPKPICALIK